MKKNKFLIINPFGIGDVLFTTPLIDNIKADVPESSVSYLCNKRAKAVVENNPLIDKIFVYERDDFEAIKKESFWLWLKKMKELIDSIRSERYDCVFDCSLNAQYGLMCLLAGIKNRIGFNYKKRGKFLTKKKTLLGYEGKHVIEYYLELLPMAGINAIKSEYKLYLLNEEINEAKMFLKDNGFVASEKLVALGTGGGASWGKDAYKKQWPIDKWVNLAKKLLENEDIKLFVCAAPGEEELAQAIMDLSAKRVLTSENLSLRQFMAVLANSELMIANDGGPLHIAAALDVSTVGVFGPVDENVYGAYSLQKDKHFNVALDLECHPCYRKFRLADCNSDHACLKSLSVETIYTKAKILLGIE